MSRCQQLEGLGSGGQLLGRLSGGMWVENVGNNAATFRKGTANLGASPDRRGRWFCSQTNLTPLPDALPHGHVHTSSETHGQAASPAARVFLDGLSRTQQGQGAPLKSPGLQLDRCWFWLCISAPLRTSQRWELRHLSILECEC